MSSPTISNLNRQQRAHLIKRNRAGQPLQGRTVSILDGRTLFRVLVITGIAMLIMGLFFSPTIAYAQKTTCSRREFSPNLAQYMNKGFRLMPSGDANCALKIPPRECIERITQEINDRKGKNLSPFYQDRGVPNKENDVFVLMNPKKMQNYKDALVYLEEKVIHNTDFYQMEDQAMLDLFKQLNRIVLKDLPQPIPAGNFRNSISVENLYYLEGNFRLSMTNQIRRVGTREDFNILTNSFRKFIPLDKDSPENNDWLRILTSQERRVWEKLIICYPLPEEIDGLMIDFVQRLKRYHKEGMSGTRLACFVAERIRAIKPFEDGNTRMELLGLNAFLKREVGEEIVVPDARVYNAKIQEEKKNPGAFCTYVEQTLIPWTKNNKNELGLST